MRLASIPILLGCVTPLAAQTADQAAFRERLEAVPLLPTNRVALELDVDPALGRVSALTTDGDGNIYVFHRPTEGDPVVVLDSDGRFVRSWGEGLFHIPHGIRVDPDGNVWTVDANTSKIYKFDPMGDVLLDLLGLDAAVHEVHALAVEDASGLL